MRWMMSKNKIHYVHAVLKQHVEWSEIVSIHRSKKIADAVAKDLEKKEPDEGSFLRNYYVVRRHKLKD
jgi:hypothetical protein